MIIFSSALSRKLLCSLAQSCCAALSDWVTNLYQDISGKFFLYQLYSHCSEQIPDKSNVGWLTLAGWLRSIRILWCWQGFSGNQRVGWMAVPIILSPLYSAQGPGLEMELCTCRVHLPYFFMVTVNPKMVLRKNHHPFLFYGMI